MKTSSPIRDLPSSWLIAGLMVVVGASWWGEACGTAVFAWSEPAAPVAAAQAPPDKEDAQPRFELVTVRGRVVFFGEAFQRLHGIKTVDEASERTLALETPSGELLPMVEDVRGRGFRNDPRLRSYDVELLARRYRGSPALQILKVWSLEKSGRYELDYWCDVCAIAMFELKPCECCQGETEFRRRRVAE